MSERTRDDEVFIRKGRRGCAVVLLLVVLGVGLLAWWSTNRRDEYDPASDALTAERGAEFEAALNFIFDTLDSNAAYENPELACDAVTVGNYRQACIAAHSTPGAIPDTRLVREIRLIEVADSCAVVIAVHSSRQPGGVAHSVFILQLQADIWKVEGSTDALRYRAGSSQSSLFDEVNPDVPYACG